MRGAGRILVADDQKDVLEALRLLLKGEGLECETASSPAGALAALEARDFDAALIDLNYARDTTSGQEGLDLLARVRELDAHLPVLVMTAWGTVDLAVEAMRRGARDFVQKPWDNARLLTTLRTQIALGRALRRGDAPRGREPDPAQRGGARDDRRLGRDAPRAGRHRARRARRTRTCSSPARTAPARASWRAPSTRPRSARPGPS